VFVRIFYKHDQDSEDRIIRLNDINQSADGSMLASDFKTWIHNQLNSYNIDDLEKRCKETFTGPFNFTG